MVIIFPDYCYAAIAFFVFLQVTPVLPYSHLHSKQTTFYGLDKNLFLHFPLSRNAGHFFIILGIFYSQFVHNVRFIKKKRKEKRLSCSKTNQAKHFRQLHYLMPLPHSFIVWKGGNLEINGDHANGVNESLKHLQLKATNVSLSLSQLIPPS